MSHPGDEETLDDLLHGRLRIYQKTQGFRYSIDALLLADFAGKAIKGRKPGSIKVLDLGSGTGVIPLALSLCPEIGHIVGLEIAGPMVEMSRRSVTPNSLDEKISIIEGDIRKPPAELQDQQFDLIVANPPYRRKGEGRLNPDHHKAIARHEITVNLQDIVKTASRLIKPRGVACFIYGAYRMTDLLSGLRGAGIEPVRMRFIHSRLAEPAKMLLIEAHQDGPAEVKIDPPLLVYRDENNYTEEVELIFQGP